MSGFGNGSGFGGGGSGGGGGGGGAVDSVAGKTGVVTLDHDDITDFDAEAAAVAPVQSVAGKAGAVTLVEADITDLGAYEPVQDAASQAEAEAGTQAAIRSFSPLRVAQAIAALTPSSTPSLRNVAAADYTYNQGTNNGGFNDADNWRAILSIDSDITITGVGVEVASVTQAHDVYLYESDINGTLGTLLATATSPSTGAGSYAVATFSSPVELTAAQQYYAVRIERNGGASWNAHYHNETAADINFDMGGGITLVNWSKNGVDDASKIDIRVAVGAVTKGVVNALDPDDLRIPTYTTAEAAALDLGGEYVVFWNSDDGEIQAGTSSPFDPLPDEAAIAAGYSPVGHTHTESDITDLDKYTQAEVDALLSPLPVLTNAVVQENELGAAAATIDIDLSNYEGDEIELWATLRSSNSGDTYAWINFNDDDTDGNYDHAVTQGLNDTTVSANGGNQRTIGPAGDASLASGVFGTLHVRVTGLRSGVKAAAAVVGGAITTSYDMTNLVYVEWNNTARVTKLTLRASAGNWVTGSRVLAVDPRGKSGTPRGQMDQARLTSNQSIPSASPEWVSLQSILRSDMGGFNLGADPTVWTAPAPGVYRAQFGGAFAHNTTGNVRILGLTKNKTITSDTMLDRHVLENPDSGAVGVERSQSVSAEVYLERGETLAVYAYHDATGSLDFMHSSYPAAVFTVTRLSGPADTLIHTGHVISDVTLAADGSLDLSGLDLSSYDEVLLRLHAQHSAGSNVTIALRFNGDTGANYGAQSTYVDTAGAITNVAYDGASGLTSAPIGQLSSNLSAENYNFITVRLVGADSAARRTFGWVENAFGGALTEVGNIRWLNAAAVTSIQWWNLTGTTAEVFEAGSRLQVIGYKLTPVGGDLVRPAITAKSANYTLLASDEGDVIEVDASGGNRTITLPNSLPVGFRCDIINVGASGSVILSAAGTLTSKGSLTTLASQYGAASVYKATSTVWRAFGDLS